MKVLQFGKFFPIKGGIEKVMFDLSASLIDKGVKTEVLCAIEDRKNNNFIYNNIPVHATGTIINLYSTMISPFMVYHLRKISCDYDIIHIHHPDPMAAISLYLSNYKGKVVLQWHSDIIKQKKLLLLFTPLQSWLLERADVIIVTTPIYAQHSFFLRKFQHKIKIVPIGINAIEPTSEYHQIRKQYKGKKIIFSLGRLIYYKGFEYLIKAAHLLNDDYVIIIGGSGPLENELKDLINREKLNQKVFLVGRIPEALVNDYFEACDIFCLSSIEKSEAFGIVLLEAMAHSKPIIATNIEGSGVSWVNKHGVSGINVLPKDYEMIAKAIMDICNNETLKNQLSFGSRLRFEQLFTIDKMSDSILEIYNDLICKQ